MAGQHPEWKMPNLVSRSTLLRLKERSGEQLWKESGEAELMMDQGLPLIQVYIRCPLRYILFPNRIISGTFTFYFSSLISHLRGWSSESIHLFYC